MPNRLTTPPGGGVPVAVADVGFSFHPRPWRGEPDPLIVQRPTRPPFPGREKPIVVPWGGAPGVMLSSLPLRGVSSRRRRSGGHVTTLARGQRAVAVSAPRHHQRAHAVRPSAHSAAAGNSHVASRVGRVDAACCRSRRRDAPRARAPAFGESERSSPRAQQQATVAPGAPARQGNPLPHRQCNSPRCVTGRAIHTGRADGAELRCDAGGVTQSGMSRAPPRSPPARSARRCRRSGNQAIHAPFGSRHRLP